MPNSIYSDPDDIGESKRVHFHEQGRDVGLQHLVPLNGEWSDLTAHFDFLDRGESYAVKLEWLHVL